MTITKALGVALFVLLSIACVRAQTNEKVRQTYRGPDVSPLWELLKEPGAKDARVDVLKFTPAGDSGVMKALADALGDTPQERAGLVQAFTQLKQGYEAEVAREGKSNNLAAAMAFFIAANVMAYQQTDMPSDADMTKLNGIAATGDGASSCICADVGSGETSHARLARVHRWFRIDELHAGETARRCARAGDDEAVCRLLDASGSWD